MKAQGEMTSQPTLQELLESAEAIRVGQLEVDPGGYRATFKGRPLSLSASQLEVLCLLLANHSRVCSRRELSEALGLHGARTVDVILSEIRRSVGRQFLRNVHSMGWIVDPQKLTE